MLERGIRVARSFKAYLCFAVILLIALESSFTIAHFRAQIVKDDTDPLQRINTQDIVQPTTSIMEDTEQLHRINTQEIIQPMKHIKRDTDQLQRINTQQILHPVRRKNVGRSYGIHLIGERHSGTNWITNHLEACFGHSVKVKPRLTRFKHWFQYPPRELEINKLDYGVVVALVRNPVDWMLAMIEKPHHSLAHWNLTTNSPLTWKDFVTKSWTLDRHEYSKYLAGDDLALMENVKNGLMSQEDLLNTTCLDEMTWRHIVPCAETDRKASAKMTKVTRGHVMYELNYDESGLPYKSIAELRRDKILNFFRDVPNMAGVSHFIPLRYEDVVTQGSMTLIQSIENALGVKAMCEPAQPQTLTPKQRSYFFVQWMNENMDWDAEALAGYKKENFTDELKPLK